MAELHAEKVRVLLIDDDEDDFIITRGFFWEISKTNYSVDWASTYEEGLAKVREGNYDIYLLDYLLGTSTGLDLLKEINAEGNRAPIILLTGQGDQPIDMEAMRMGAADFLVKGEINSKSLERAVRYSIERKRAEQQIQKLASFPRCNPHPVLEFASDGSLTYSNIAAGKLAKDLGQPGLAYILPVNTSTIVENCLKSGCTREDLRTTVGQRTFAWSFVPIVANRVVHCYATEITERLNLEAQLRHSVKMEAIGQLAAGVAHDFNNILTIIQGHADLLKSSVSAAQQQSLEQICSAADRASNLIRQLLMFSRKQVMQPRFLDVNELIEGMSLLLKRLIGADIDLVTEPAANLPAVYADAGMIEQILLNLCVNARDAMPRGGKLTLSTSTAEFDRRNRPRHPDAMTGFFVCLAVTDTGTGIQADTISRIFEPFYTTKEVGKGTGLGLATVYGIVRQHQGWIDVESQMNSGTTFKIYLPGNTVQAEKHHEPPRGAAVEGGTETILVVEDEPALRELVVEILKLYGYNVFSAGSGVAALDVWQDKKKAIDLLLTDMVMPEGISGRDLADRLVREKPSLKVIYTSGYSPGMAGKDLALLEGFNFLPKPYPPARLAEVVRECLHPTASAAGAANGKAELTPATTI